MKLNKTQIKTALKNLSGWELLEGRLEKTFNFDSYPNCVAFALKVALAAEKADHHPDSLEIMWGKVKVAYVTHSAKGITQLDIDAAAKVNTLLA